MTETMDITEHVAGIILEQEDEMDQTSNTADPTPGAMADDSGIGDEESQIWTIDYDEAVLTLGLKKIIFAKVQNY